VQIHYANNYAVIANVKIYYAVILSYILLRGNLYINVIIFTNRHVKAGQRVTIGSLYYT